MPTPAEMLEVDGFDIKVTNPDKVYFPDAEGGPITKLEVVRYWATVAEPVLAGCRDRPGTLHRFPAGVADDGAGSFYQKRLPKGAPEWVPTALITFPSGRHAQMPVMRDAATLVWAATLVPRVQPVARARRRRSSRRAARGPRPHAGRAVGRRPPGGADVP